MRNEKKKIWKIWARLKEKDLGRDRKRKGNEKLKEIKKNLDRKKVERKRFLTNNFEMKDTGDVLFVLGIQLLRDHSQGILGFS